MSFVEPSESELACVESLKSKLFDEFPELAASQNFNPTTILRFYRGFKGKVDNAYNGLKKYIDWRVEKDVDNIDKRTSQFQRELDSGKAVVGMSDLNGRPAAFVYAHKHNKYDREVDEVLMLTIWVLEHLRKSAKPEEERFVAVVDLGSFTMKCMDYEVVKHQIAILQTHYPDTVESIYITDAPMIFSACWLIIKPWLDPVTANKVQFIKSSKLSEYFDSDVIPNNA